MNEQLSINLTSDISYVYGTVNGIEAKFSLTAPCIWSATVPKSNDSRYEIIIIAYNNAGTSTTYNTIIYKLDDIMTPKTNWTKDDFYNAEDLNRVEANTQYVAELIALLLKGLELEPIIVNRDYKTIEFADDLNRVERNLEKLNVLNLKGLKPLKTNWKVGDPFDYNDANRYENNLNLLYKILKPNINNIKYCGTFNCGEEVI